MANVWVGDNYYVTGIYQKMDSDTSDGVAVDRLSQIVVRLQRTPTSTYPNTTDIALEINSTNTDKFPSGLAQADYLANVLPLVNTALTASDAAFDGSASSTYDVTSHTKTYG